MAEPGWSDWVNSRPAVVQDLCRRFPPNHTYRVGRATCRITSYSEDGTVTVLVDAKDNPHELIPFTRKVFGVTPDELEQLP